MAVVTMPPSRTSGLGPLGHRPLPGVVGPAPAPGGRSGGQVAPRRRPQAARNETERTRAAQGCVGEAAVPGRTAAGYYETTKGRDAAVYHARTKNSDRAFSSHPLRKEPMEVS